MNILGLVFSVLLILSYGFYACWDKQLASSRLRTTYVSHEKVNRKILNSYQSKVYDHLGSQKKTPEPHEEETDEEEVSQPAQPKSKKPDLNRECARLNLWPLIQEGREAHPTLYELAAKMIRTFYSPLQNQKKRFEYHFLDALLAAAKAALQQRTPFALEKVDLNDADLQRIYYKMLKGTKQWDLSLGLGYPSLLDYVKAERSTEKICLFHAHPDLITALFNGKIAASLYAEIHQKEGPAVTKELVEKVCSEHHQISVDPELFKLLEFGKPFHEEHKKTFIAEEGEISLRKNLYLKS